jgi:Protein of unknown function (DUF3102)
MSTTNKAELEAKALSLVPQINAAYQAMIAAGLDKAPLEKAIALGKLLKLAKEALGHGKFMAYLGQHCPKISQRTANVYMLVANKEEHLRANWQRAANLAGDGTISIRTALVELRTPQEKKAAEERAAKATKAAKEALSAPVSLEEELRPMGVDDVLGLLTTTFDVDFLDTLYKALGKHLEENAPEEEAKAQAPAPTARSEVPTDAGVRRL